MISAENRSNVDEAPSWKPTVFWLSVTQAVLLLIAAFWGWMRHIALQPLHLPSSEKEMLLALGALMLGAVISLLSNSFLNFCIRRGSKTALWVRDVLLRPLFKDIPIPASIWLAALSAFAEEFCFRLILLAETGPFISSIIFGLLHGGHRCLRWYIIWAALMGVLFCLLVQLSGSLWPSIAMHFACNLTSFILILRQTHPHKNR